MNLLKALIFGKSTVSLNASHSLEDFKRITRHNIRESSEKYGRKTRVLRGNYSGLNGLRLNLRVIKPGRQNDLIGPGGHSLIKYKIYLDPISDDTTKINITMLAYSGFLSLIFTTIFVLVFATMFILGGDDEWTIIDYIMGILPLGLILIFVNFIQYQLHKSEADFFERHFFKDIKIQNQYNK